MNIDPDAHADRVSRLTRRIAERLGLDPEVCDLYARAAALHDVGKTRIPASILEKPGPLSDAEREEVERHTLIGAAMLAHEEQEFLRTASVIALTHHERWDGDGYPFGLEKLDIPLASRIVAVADVFDCLSTERPYKQAVSVEVARAMIRGGSGSHFDPMCVMAFETTFSEALPEQLERMPHEADIDPTLLRDASVSAQCA